MSQPRTRRIPSLSLKKSFEQEAGWQPFERGVLTCRHVPAGSRLLIADADGWTYGEAPAGKRVRFDVRGAPGVHRIRLLARDGHTLAEQTFRLQPRTRISCDREPFGHLAGRLEKLLCENREGCTWWLRGRPRRMFVSWGRDHVHVLKAMKYFFPEVTSALDFWLETQEPDGMVWDCIAPNPCAPGPAWLGEALGPRFCRYEEGGRYVMRRIPVEADCEFLYAEGVWQAWKATGDDAWMARQVPRLERALRYLTTHPERWSAHRRLVRRSLCMDSWDFANPHFCAGDARCINPGDRQFLFHGDNSGLYAFYWRLAEMVEHLGQQARGAQLRQAAEALRQRANATLFFRNTYGHMIPERGDPAPVYALVGDERKRMSFSLGYTINRGLPNHRMAVRILKEYQRRGRQKARQSFAEWFAMDPPYTLDQWPAEHTGGSFIGEYMNGGISPVVAGELARAAFAHGLETYGADILRRVWNLTERDGGVLHDTYRQAPANLRLPPARFTALDLRGVVNRGLRQGAHPGVVAWQGEGDNDMRHLPVGRRKFGAIRFSVIDPARNEGKAVLHLPAGASAMIPGGSVTAQSLYFLHAHAGPFAPGTHVATCRIGYTDGTEATVDLRIGFEINRWWNPSDACLGGDSRTVDRSCTRVAWRGANPTWKDVGVYMFGWNNPRPDQPVAQVRVTCRKGEYYLLAISASDQPVAFEPRLRSHGLPAAWGQAAVFHGLAEGLAGVEDRGRGFDRVLVSPRWAATAARRAEVCLHYPASGACCAYRYWSEPRRRRLRLDLTGNFSQAEVQCLLPESTTVRSVVVDGAPVPFSVRRIEQSRYAVFTLDARPVGPVTIVWQSARGK